MGTPVQAELTRPAPQQEQQQQRRRLARFRAMLCVPCLLCLALLFAPLVTDAARSKGAAQPFLATELPLKIIATTPVELLTAADGQGLQLQGRQALTAVFSRPVIALGSDFVAQATSSSLPFSISCRQPGRFRWVTTTIARFDPYADWPTDLDCSFVWNSKLSSYDGVALQVPTPVTRTLTSHPLSMQVMSVKSATSDNLTSSLWDANVGMPDDGLPEVLPDGRIQLSFGYEVDLALLSTALQLLPDGKGASPLKVTVQRCNDTDDSNPWSGTLSKSAKIPAPSVTDLATNSTCAVVLPQFAGLAPNTGYKLFLPKGTRYHALAGPLMVDLSLPLFGRRRFRVPLRQDFEAPTNPQDVPSDGTSYRRLDLWLPASLQDFNASLPSLASAISLAKFENGYSNTSSKTPVPFELSAVNSGKVRLIVPTLQPSTRYAISVAASDDVRDGYGQPLLPTSAAFWTREVQPTALGPSGRNLGRMSPFTFEPSARPTSWPYISSSNRSIRGGAWLVDPTTSMVQLLKLMTANDVYVPSVLGEPKLTADTTSNSDTHSRLDVPLTSSSSSSSNVGSSGGSSMYIVHTYLPDMQTPGVTKQSSDITLLQVTPLSAVLLLAGIADALPEGSDVMPDNNDMMYSGSNGKGMAVVWVTDTAMEGPVEGAAVQLWASSWNKPAKQIGTCTTAANGVCQVPVPPNPDDSFTYIALVSKDFGGDRGKASFLTEGTSMPFQGLYGQYSGWNGPSNLLGSLVLGRQLFTPEDSLHITGYTQQRQGAALVLPLPNTFQAFLQVQPNWLPSTDGSDSYATPPIPIEVNSKTGSFHVTLPVPAKARLGSYSLQLMVNKPSSGKALQGQDGRRLLRKHTQLAVLPTAEELVVGESDVAFDNGGGSTSSGGGTSRISAGDVMGSNGGLSSAVLPNFITMASSSELISGISSSSSDGVSSSSRGAITGKLAMAVAALTADMPRYDVGGSGGSSSNAQLAAMVTSTSFTLADPRPPTAELTLGLPSWVKPNAPVHVNVTAASYIGSSVDEAKISITWSTAKAQGVLTIKTGADGTGEGIIDLGALPAEVSATAGDSLSVQAEWIGPTRERITQTGSVSLAASLRSVAVQLSYQTSIPLVPFGVSAAVTSAADNSAIDGIPLTIQLRPDPSLNDTACQDVASCTLRSGDGDAAAFKACQLSLPCIGTFELRVCTADSDSKSDPDLQLVCTSQQLGWNASTWAASPWDSHTEPQLTSDKAVYVLGSSGSAGGDGLDALLVTHNPWGPLLGLLLLSTVDGIVTTKQLQIPAGPVELPIPILPSYIGGVQATLVLSVPRLSPSALVLDPAVPISKLFDPRAPHSHTLSVVLDVQPNNTLDVTLTLVQQGSSASNSAGSFVVLPGGKATVSVSVSQNGAPTEGAEVTFVAVDKAFLDLLPLPLQSVASELALHLAAGLQSTDPDGARVAPGTLDAVFDTAMRRLNLDPWAYPDLRLNFQHMYYSRGFGGPSAAPVDMPDDLFFAGLSTPITYLPEQYGLYPQRNFGMMESSFALAAAVAPSATDAGGAVAARAIPDGALAKNAGMSNDMATTSAAAPLQQSPAPAGNGLRVLSKQDATPLFTWTTTAADGNGSAMFTAPPGLGTYVIRAYAALGAKAAYGAAETKIIVRRPLSLTPALPRFARVSDSFDAGVLVTLPTMPATAVKVTLNVAVALQFGSGEVLALEQGASDRKEVQFAPGETQVEVRFPFRATGVGFANLTFTATDSDGHSDALQVQLEVQAPQGDVFIATSFVLSSTANGSTSAWQEGLVLPAAVQGSGTLGLLAGVGHLPALQSSFQQLSSDWASSTYPNAYSAVAICLIPTVLQQYGQPVPSEALSAVAGAYSALSMLTHPTFGLQYSDSRRWGGTIERSDIMLNVWAAWLVAGYSVPADSAYAKQWQSLQALVKKWQAAAVRQLLLDATEQRSDRYSPGPYSDITTLAWFRLALGSSWTAPICKAGKNDLDCLQQSQSQVADDLSFARLLKRASNDSSTSGLTIRLLVALSLQPSGGGGSDGAPLLTAVTQQLASGLRVQGRTAYVTSTPGAASAAGMDMQSLALLLLLPSHTATDLSQLLPKLAAYVAGSSTPDTSGLTACQPSAYSAAMVAKALAAYDAMTGSAQPELNLVAEVGNVTVLQASFSPSSPALLSSTTKYEDLPSPPPSLAFAVNGSGQASIAASLHFVPLRLLNFPTYRGLYLESSIQLASAIAAAADGADSGGSGSSSGSNGSSSMGGLLAVVPLGSVVQLAVQVTTPDDLGPVTLEVRMPAGLEPLDPALTSGSDDGSSQASHSCPLLDTLGGSYGSASPRYYSWWWRPVCPAQETKPTMVTFSFLRLPAGAVTVTFRAVAATPGTFVLPPSRAFAVQQPELSGSSAGGQLSVCVPPCTALYKGRATPPRRCPADCSGNGVCNLARGTCMCNPDWSGVACSAENAQRRLA